MTRRLTPALFLCAVLAGCGGGGGSTLPQTQPSSLPASKSKAPQRVTVSITVPAAKSSTAALKRTPRYVSVNTQSASISVMGATPVVVDLSAGSPNCTTNAAGGRVCTTTVSAPVGTDTFAEVTFDGPNATGSALSQATTSAVIAPGVANTVALTLDGIVATIGLTLANPTPPVGVAATIPLTVTFTDASGAAIIGNDPFTNPITLTDSDTSATKLPAKSVLASPGDAVGLTVSYSGAPLASAVFSATATGVQATQITPITMIPSTTSAATFVDWPTYGFDIERSGFNPSTTGITPASIGNLHLAWHIETQGSQTQPIVVTNVIPGHPTALIIGNYANLEAHDALTGATLWQTPLPKQDVQACGTSGVAGTATYDAALGAVFVAAGNGLGTPNHIVLYKLSVATGALIGQVDVTPVLEPGEANDSHAGVQFVNGQIYVGTGSDCEGDKTIAYPSWRGRVVSVDPAAMAITNTFFTTYGQGGGNFGGGGVWGWGGVSADPFGNIYLAAGNAETNATAGAGEIQPPFTPTDNEQAGYAENLVQLGSTLVPNNSNYPGFNFAIGFIDLDYTGTPVIFQPSSCDVLSATQGKGGTLVINDTENKLAFVNSFALSVPSARAFYMGNPTYSPITQFLYAPITSSGVGSSLLMPGLAAISGCGTTMPWHATFGPDSTTFAGDNPRSAPTVTAGGVVFEGTPCTVTAGSAACGGGAGGAPSGGIWAIDAGTGAVLGGGNPVLLTGDNIRMPPTADGLWVWVYDNSGNLYGLTVDPSIPTAPASKSRRLEARFHYGGDKSFAH